MSLGTNYEVAFVIKEILVNYPKRIIISESGPFAEIELVG